MGRFLDSFNADFVIVAGWKIRLFNLNTKKQKRKRGRIYNKSVVFGVPR